MSTLRSSSTSEHGIESETNVFDIQRRLLGDNYPLYLDISQVDFDALLVKICPSVSSFVCTTLFHEIDKVGSGWIDAESIVQYLRRGEEQCSRVLFVVSRMLRASVEGCLLFISGSSISISNNILHRRMKPNLLLKVLGSPLRMWCFLIGSLCFAWEACTHFSKHGAQYKSLKIMLTFIWENLTSLDQVCELMMKVCLHHTVLESKLVSCLLSEYLKAGKWLLVHWKHGLCNSNPRNGLQHT